MDMEHEALGTMVPFETASALIDEFEQLLLTNGISVPRQQTTGADMLSVWHLLQFAENSDQSKPEDSRPLLRHGWAAYDLAARVLQIKTHSDFSKLIPHLKMLNAGAISLTNPPAVDADSYNKLIELYWACLCMSVGLSIEIDHPTNATGRNPDVIALSPTSSRGYALKTIRALNPQTIMERIEEGIDQIEKSPAESGVVVLNLTPRINHDALFPENTSFPDASKPISMAIDQMREIFHDFRAAIPEAERRLLVKNKKAFPIVLGISFSVASCIAPGSSLPTATPLRVLVVEGLYEGSEISPDLNADVRALHHSLQMSGPS